MRTLTPLATERLLTRNPISRRFFESEAERLARACRDMASRFSRGGRLLAFGAANAVTDAQHVVVEFVHPVIVGKRALPAIDVSLRYRPFLSALAGPDDIVMGFDPSGKDTDVARALSAARARGAQIFALAGRAGDYAIDVIDPDPFVHQEITETLYHVLWETVHVFLEQTTIGHDAGRAAFLYPFLGTGGQDGELLIAHVSSSILSKARDDERLREEVAQHQGEVIVAAVEAIRDRLSRGGKLFMLGNGGSATDATDWVLDCIDSPKGHPSIPAVSLAAEPATMSALANDIGHDLVFVRQLIAHARPADVVIAITTSGGSANVIAALEEARRRELLTIALTGYDGGEIVRRHLADFAIIVGSDCIPRIQEIHASVYHVMTDLMAAEA